MAFSKSWDNGRKAIYTHRYRPLRAKCFDNPYLFDDTITREEQIIGQRIWYGEEQRPGEADLRLQVLRRDQWQCQECNKMVTLTTSHLDHIRPVRKYKQLSNANHIDNLQTMCISCHKAKTESERQMESRMR